MKKIDVVFVMSDVKFHKYFSDSLMNGLRWLFGFLMSVLSVAFFVSLLSYDCDDPSFNTAVNWAPSNLLSYFGSYFSDMAIQLLGGASYLFTGFFGLLGVEIYKKSKISYIRIFCGIIAIMLCASICQRYFCYGGVIGSFLIAFEKTNNLLRNNYIFLITNFAIFIACVVVVLNIRLEDIKDVFYKFRMLFSNVIEVTKLDECKIEEEDIHNVAITKTTQDARKESKVERVKNHKTASRQSVSSFEFPTLDFLKESTNVGEKISSSELGDRANVLLKVLNDFGISGEIIGVNPGPVVTLYELKPSAGIKSSRVIGLAGDIARYMSAVSARVSVISGRNALGIELPNKKRGTVFLREILESKSYTNSSSIPIVLGKNIGGDPVVVDLAKMPHLLIAGTTGSGKSVGINSMILSILYKLSPAECRFIMIDPKMLELSVYDNIPHLLTPVVTDPQKAIIALKWAVKEMENRYVLMSKLGVRNIENYNAKVLEMKKKGDVFTRSVQTGFDPESSLPIYEEQQIDFSYLPFIVIVVDEMADLMLVAGKEIEIAVQRLAQMARAAGIHLIMATQRPSVDVITGTIKANFPTRISFQVSSKIDSRTILGEQGAEQLLGQGDMLYMPSGGRMVRVHGPFVSDQEVEEVVNFLKSRGVPDYVDSVTDDVKNIENESESSVLNDPMYDKAMDIVLREGKVSTSFIQRQLQIGYNRAARIVETMEKNGIVSPANHTGRREILGRSKL